MATRVGMITIGQSPRPDVVPEVTGLAGQPIEVVEAGALDGLVLDEVRRLRPGPNDETMVTRMADGLEVHVAKRHIVPCVQACIDRLAPKVEVMVLLCTGRFPGFRSPVPFLEPQGLVDRVTQSVVGEAGAVGIMVPAAAQIAASRQKMEEYGLVPTVVAASPYTDGEGIRRAAERFRDAKVSAVVMHCIGYDLKMKAEVRRVSRKPVILARSLVAKILGELL